jgi:hypothetical protein
LEVHVGEAIPVAPIVKRGWDKEDMRTALATQLQRMEEIEKSESSDDKDHEALVASENLPFRLFQSLSLVLLSNLLLGLIASIFAAFGLLKVGWNNNPDIDGNVSH